MAKEKPGVMMYWETFDVLESLPDEQAMTMMHAIRHYSQYGELPDFEKGQMLSTLWLLIGPKLDADNERYEQIRESRRRAGRASAAKRLADASKREQVLTDASKCEQIQPTTTTASTTTATPTTASTTNPATSSRRDCADAAITRAFQQRHQQDYEQLLSVIPDNLDPEEEQEQARMKQAAIDMLRNVKVVNDHA